MARRLPAAAVVPQHPAAPPAAGNIAVLEVPLPMQAMEVQLYQQYQQQWRHR